jgi:tetrahydromethanopterin S-methyltransferase subunit F
VGAGTDLRTLSISAPATSTDAYATAWIPGNPKTTPDPTNAGALHDTAAVSGIITKVAGIGQWDWQALSGNGAGLTVTASMPDLSGFAPKERLRLVGWDNTTGKWVALGTSAPAANTENTLISGTMTAGIGAIGIGSIAAGLPDLTPAIEIDNPNFDEGQTTDFVVNIFEIANNITDGSTISFAITKPLSWAITVPGITLSGTNQTGVNSTSNVGGGTANQNGNCFFRETSGFVIVTLKPAQFISANGSLTVGLKATRKTGALSGVSQALTVSVASNSGGDNTVSNNKTNTFVTAN